MYPVDDTIVAIASATGGAARGIIRISGPQTIACVEDCFAPERAFGQRSAESVLGELSMGSSLPPVDARLYLWPTKRSFTGQPTAEFHLIGSPPLLEAAVRRICEADARLAEPGEFTLRAFLAGRIDLPQAEAVLGIINANSERQLATALHQLSGGLSGPLNDLRDRLLNLLADLEAGLDFVDEDIEYVSTEQLATELLSAKGQIGELCRQLENRSDSRQVPRVVLIGRPNAGKSTLWNALRDHFGDITGRSDDTASSAIVSNVPGTTRDYLSAGVDICGQVCELIDTAGVEEDFSHDPKETGAGHVDHAAQTKTDVVVSEADLILLCVESGVTLNDWERQQLEKRPPTSTLLVITKHDLVGREQGASVDRFLVVETSAHRGEGLAELRTEIGMRLNSEATSEGRALASTATRCRESLRLAFESVDRSAELNAIAAGEELIASELRLALNELGKVAGSVYTDDVLDRIFSRFCIGK